MSTTTQLTVSDAALQVGVTRQTIFKAIKTGKLSATQNNRGHMQINIVELLRVYGELQSPEQVAQNKVHRAQQSPTLPASAGLQLELERMKLLIERKDFELEQMRERVAELKTREQQANEERLRVFGLLEQQTRLLAAPVPAKPAPRAAAKLRATTPSKNPAAKPKTAATPLRRAQVSNAAKEPAQARKTQANTSTKQVTKSKTVATPLAKSRAKPTPAKKTVAKATSSRLRKT
jgi:hypothetical protein